MERVRAERLELVAVERDACDLLSLQALGLLVWVTAHPEARGLEALEKALGLRKEEILDLLAELEEGGYARYEPPAKPGLDPGWRVSPVAWRP